MTPARGRAQGWRGILLSALPRGTPARQGRAGRIGKELWSYLAMAAYLYACFGSLLLYKAMLLHDRGVDYAPYGLAAGKALLLAKFMLIGDKLQLGAQIRGGSQIYFIICKSALFCLLIIGLSVVEEATVGLLHGRPVGDTLVGLGHGRLGEIMAMSLLLFVILIPYFVYREIDTMLGEGKLLEMLRRRR